MLRGGIRTHEAPAIDFISVSLGLLLMSPFVQRFPARPLARRSLIFLPLHPIDGKGNKDKDHHMLPKFARLAVNMCAIGIALYGFIFIFAFGAHFYLDTDAYNRLVYDRTYIPLTVAGAFLFPGLLLAEMVFQILRRRP